nr:hypothetical protein BaRGS_009281 [Batillaria attramentaria]
MFHPEDQRKMEARLEIHKDKTLSEATAAVHKLFELEGLVDVSCCRLVKYDEYLDSLERSFEGEEDTCISTLLGVTVKVFVVDIQTETIHPPVSVRAYLVQTVEEFKSLLSKVVGLPNGNMRLVLERFHNDLRLLTTPAKTLKAEGFFKSNKVYVECSGDVSDAKLPYVHSRLYRLLDRHQNTIRIHVNIPTQESVTHYLQNLQQSRQRLQYYTSRGLGGNAGGDSSSGGNMSSLREQRRSSLGGVAGGDYSGEMDEVEGGGVYRVYSNNQEFESVRLSDTLSFLEDGKLNVKMGRALRPGEHRVKVYQLNVNDAEPCKFLTETIFAKGMTVLESKQLIVAELKDKCGLDIPLERCRLRKKSWKNPGTVYINSQVYEDEIAIFPNWEVFLEILDKPDELTSMQQLAIYLRRWRPSSFTLDPFQEVVLSHQSVEELKQKIAAVSSIPVENVEFAKGKGTFPCETSVLEMHSDLDWNPQVTSLNVWPLYICDDGHVIYYRDKTEELAELSEEKKKEIQQKENISFGSSSAATKFPFQDPTLSWAARMDDLMKRLTVEEVLEQLANPGRDLMYRVAEATGVEARAKNNYFRQQGNFSLHTSTSCFSPETYGEDPYLTGEIATSFVHGLQGNDSRYVRASAGCKHLAAYDGPENIPLDRHSFNAQIENGFDTA